jgi:hypothetical protein
MMTPRRPLSWRISLIALAVALGGGSLMAQKDTATAPRVPRAAVGRLLGVFDEQSSAPILDAEVVDGLSEQSFRTQESGLIGLAGFRRQNDSAVVRVRKVGYRDTTLLVMLGPADTVPVLVFIHRVTTLPKVITEAIETKHKIGGMREFEDRLNDKSNQGKFVTPEELRKNDSRTLADVLSSIGYPGGRCTQVRFFLDGRFVYAALTTTLSKTNKNHSNAVGSIDLNQSVVAYDAIEFYGRAAAPMEYGPCSVLLWSRGS